MTSAMTRHVSSSPDGAILSLRAQPRSSKRGFAIDGETLKLRIRSAPVDGKANKELVEPLADIFGISKSRVKLVGGDTSKQKRFLLSGLDAAEAEAVIMREASR